MMKVLDNPYDMARGVVTVEFSDGERVYVDERAFREWGLKGVATRCGKAHLLPTERVDVYQAGRKVGTVPADFHPMTVVSKSFFFDMRAGDFVLDGGKWLAHRSLGPGDLQAVPGFVCDTPQRNTSGLEELAALGAVFSIMAEKRKPDSPRLAAEGEDIKLSSEPPNSKSI